MKRRASVEMTPIPQIYQEEVTAANIGGIINGEVVAQLPNFQACSSSVYCARRRRFPVLPQRRQDIVLEGQWSQTADGQDFVLANDGEVDKLLIFGTIEGLMQVCRANTVYMDGTLYAVPRLFAQLYTVHAKEHGQCLRYWYGLFPNRTEETYQRFDFTNLIRDEAIERGFLFDPDTIMVDFVMAAIQAYNHVLPGSNIKGCLFHYGQCIQRCIQRIMACRPNTGKQTSEVLCAGGCAEHPHYLLFHWIKLTLCGNRS
jgi:hypothetical protein